MDGARFAGFKAMYELEAGTKKSRDNFVHEAKAAPRWVNLISSTGRLAFAG